MTAAALAEELKPPRKKWAWSRNLALARQGGAICGGSGRRRAPRARVLCNCTYREIFRTCLRRFRYCSQTERFARVSLTHFLAGRSSVAAYGRPEQEYCADFFLVARRSLGPLEWDVFRAHILLGADWRVCCVHLRIERGAFFHAVYRIEQRLGRVFEGLKPYALFPPDEYFSSYRRVGTTSVAAQPMRRERRQQRSVRAPLALAATGAL